MTPSPPACLFPRTLSPAPSYLCMDESLPHALLQDIDINEFTPTRNAPKHKVWVKSRGAPEKILARYQVQSVKVLTPACRHATEEDASVGGKQTMLIASLCMQTCHRAWHSSTVTTCAGRLHCAALSFANSKETPAGPEKPRNTRCEERLEGRLIAFRFSLRFSLLASERIRIAWLSCRSTPAYLCMQICRMGTNCRTQRMERFHDEQCASASATASAAIIFIVHSSK